MRIRVVGAGFSGAVIARELAEAGHAVTVLDERPAVAGNCRTERDPATGVMLHLHGPHILHTDNEVVWAYLCRFAQMMPFRHRVVARVGARAFALPMNLLTLNQFFDTALSPDEARAFLAERALPPPPEGARNMEEAALAGMGEALYRAFFEGYTRKQWGVEPRALPASILKRLPLRFTYESDYFSHRFQAIPRAGYTDLVARMLDHRNIALCLGQTAEAQADGFDHTVWSGPLDRYYRNEFGPLSYRTLDFERFEFAGDYQGVAVMNFCDAEVPFTRITEHRHYAPREPAPARSVCFREFSRDAGPGDTPYYPLHLVGDQHRLARYVARARADSGVTFVGRLGTYSYIDMDVCVARALETAAALNTSLAAGAPPPVFVHAPI
ncbi:MAG: UDP-galactopyranose mutase [Phaeovulum sp.]|uniref:UDP-galactopyranose/dTDP-fucopyranose mutase family protein n=1 Tax=Phaeovulum sp. TaxID=2934796 RepID=UPI0027357FB6|nr:UDP-galactopyranose mutase [Phaeovulum sp.]MDP3862606.1 UDP-galactopyranose mutase [Phaeovulum sp.]